jgi:glutathione S-transferase
MSHVMFPMKDESLFKPYPRVTAYRDRCKARPAWNRVMERYLERVVAA